LFKISGGISQIEQNHSNNEDIKHMPHKIENCNSVNLIKQSKEHIINKEKHKMNINNDILQNNEKYKLTKEKVVNSSDLITNMKNK